MLNTEVITPLPFARGFWLIASERVLIEPPQNNAGRKKGKGGKSIKVSHPRPAQGSIDAVLLAVKNNSGMTSGELSDLLNLSVNFTLDCLKVLKKDCVVQISRYNKRKAPGKWFYYLIGELTEEQQTTNKPIKKIFAAIKRNPGLPEHEICKITKEVWPINKGGHTIYAYTAVK
jgi:hypothetical protein